MSNAFGWKRQIASFLVFISCLVFVGSSDYEQLTYCGPTSEKPTRSLVFVSTLDGKISALDAARHGEKQWTLDFDDGPMLSSSIHRRELNNNGQWVKLIPSLNGGLYKFDGENLEGIPVSMDHLLRSSFRYSDDLVFSGGKETRSYGVSATTGKILYQCNISGCTNKTNDDYNEEEVLVIQRLQQTVRAVEPRTGAERWNFSVGQHDLTLLPAETTNCHDTAAKPSQKNIVDIELKVIVPEGLVWAINKSNPNVKLWQYKFDSPIVTVWRKENTPTSNTEALEEVNLFDGSQWEWGSDFSSSPSIYLGMHEKQLYVQENEAFSKALSQSPQKQLQYPKIPWQPYPAISTAVSMTVKNVVQGENNSEMHLEISERQSTTALSVLYNSEYINGNGFYLYSKDQQRWNISNQCNESDSVIIIENVEQPSLIDYVNEEEETPVQIIIVSLWYWWKEVVIISITTAFLLNFLLTQRLLNATTIVKDAVMPPLIVERHVEAKEEDHKAFQDVGNGVDFYSRYLTDFEQIDCLGKGGYGIVFEARNKIDDCIYAIKRIALPNSRDSRERVMREVKALAKLDHHNIVRYFNAWLECPPAGWQENYDLLWKNKQEFTSETSHSVTNSKLRSSVCIDVPQSDASSVDSAFDAFELNQTTKDDDSFIVFDTDPEGARGHDRVINFSDDNSVSSNNISISMGAARIKPSSKQNMNHSESIVFQNSITSNKEKSKESIADKKSKLALDLEGTGVRKTTKMFLYIQMQLCQRLSLREWLKRQDTPRDSQRICNIFQQIVDAVEYVHLQGLIHRDLKPSNIFFAYDDKIKIGDFGLVTAMTEGFDEARTPSEQEDMINLKTGLHTACVGTHLYMSPEQMNGQVYNYKVDIYSLGIILFELLTPFTTEMERVVALMNLRKAVFPKDFAANYPAEFDLLKMMLDENPNKRPTTLGIKARPPLYNSSSQNDLSVDERNKWHFELPQLSRHSSVTSSGSGESWENITYMHI